MFAQDTWRLKPNFTLTGGLRYDVQTPFAPFTQRHVVGHDGRASADDRVSAMAVPTADATSSSPVRSGGVSPQYILLEKGTEGYKTDWNNVAPSASIAWRPDVQSGFMRAILGDPESGDRPRRILRCVRPPGPHQVHQSLWRQPRRIDLVDAAIPARAGAGGRIVAGPALADRSACIQRSFNPDPTYPIAVGANRADNVNAFTPDIKIGRVRTWTIALARSISRDMAVEIRYVGNRGVNEWSSINYNCGTTNNNSCTASVARTSSRTVSSTSSTRRWRISQANNASGVASRAGSFAYFGAGTGTSPLPIYLAYLNGRTDASNPAAYVNASTTWTNSAIAGRLAAPNPNPNAAAVDLDYNAATPRLRRRPSATPRTSSSSTRT